MPTTVSVTPEAGVEFGRAHVDPSFAFRATGRQRRAGAD